jgi:hypothetical protein
VEGPAVRAGAKGLTLTLSQNPVTGNGKIMVLLSGDNGKEELTVRDITGRHMQGAIMNNGRASLDVSGLANGFYFVNVKTANGKTVSTKMALVK